VTPSRALGQNFVVDPNTVRRIARLAAVGPGDHVVEVGAGAGSLTLALAETGASVVALELERHVVANLPYNVATPLVLDLLEGAPTIARMLVMVQREAGERLVAEPGSRTYGIPSVRVAYWATTRLVGRVGPDVFLPRPRVDSALVEIVRRPGPVVGADPERMFGLVRSGFGQRRKMLRRSLADLVTDAAFEAAGVAPTARAEELSIHDWGRLTDAVVSYGS
jgi:16S rRNA (adenine1518-N6/adenine1519-N6)-dimethyltransferase